MAAITTIQNKLVVDDVQLLSFWNDAQGNLLLAQRSAVRDSLKPPANEPTYTTPAKSSTPDPTAVKYQIMNPSTLTSFMYKDLPLVFGVIDGSIYELSPVREAIGAEATIDDNTASLAGCSDGKGLAWLYFYKGSTENKQGIQEWDYATSQFTSPAELASTLVDEMSSLAAVLIPGKDERTHLRRLYYQSPRESDGAPATLRFVEPTGALRSGILEGTAPLVKNGTPIAACLGNTNAPNGADRPRVYVYFMTSEGYIYRSVSGPGEIDVFAAPEQVSKVLQAVDFTQIAVTPSETERVNYLTYVVNFAGVYKYRVFADPWKEVEMAHRT
jgi:hypothetical protein